MTLTDELKILDSKIKNKSVKKDNVKNIANRERDFNYESEHSFYRSHKQYNEFEEMSLEMSLESKYNKMKRFTNLLTIFKNLNSKNPKTQLKKEQIMKNVDELYEKYYNDYKNDFDNDDWLDEAKKKKSDQKQFELFDKTDKKLTLDEETKKFFKQIENREKIVDKKKFKECFSYNPTALVNNLLSRDTQDLKKGLNEIKQQKIKLNKDERNSTNNKNKNDELKKIQSVINRIYQFFEYKILPGEQPDE